MLSRWSPVAVYAASEGQLGCISCHDPHRLPEPSTKAAYYRERCLECHEKKGCALPVAQRQPGARRELHRLPYAASRRSRTSPTPRRPTTAFPRSVPGSVSRSPRGPPGQPGNPADGLPLGGDDRGGAARRHADMGVALAGLPGT